MINLKFGKKVEPYGTEKKKYLFRICRNSISLRNLEKSYIRYFLKCNKRAFAICLPCKIKEAESIKWIFGWRFHEKIEFCTNKSDPVFLEIHFFNKEFLFKR